MIKQFLESMARLIPIEWDRFTETNGQYNVYGWVKRKDGQRDFVLLQLYVEENKLKGTFHTSSAKYSKTIHMLLYHTTKGHVSCKKIENITS